MRFSNNSNQKIERRSYWSGIILNGYDNIDRNICFSVKEERSTRGHEVTLAKKQCRLDIRIFSFFTKNSK